MDGDQTAKTFDDGANKAMGAAEDFGTGIHESAHQRVRRQSRHLLRSY